MLELSDVRRAWWLSETVHNVGYFAPEGKQATDALGCKGTWMGYFGMRAAPLGRVSAAVISALFIGFSPAMVARAIPDAWNAADPEDFLRTRLDVNDRVWRRVWGSDISERADIREAAGIAAEAAEAADVSGRPLAAANQALLAPEGIHVALWQSLTTLREHRGDGHASLLTAQQLDSVQALILACGYGKYPRAIMQPTRRWTDAEWDSGVAKLVDRGLVKPDGLLTEAGRRFRDELEDDTDRLARAPFDAVGLAGTRRLSEILAPLAKQAMSVPGYQVLPPVSMPDPFRQLPG
jgi:hypothetical protein